VKIQDGEKHEELHNVHPSPKYYQVYQIQGVNWMVHILCMVKMINFFRAWW